ncbi:hypothetical protein L6452_02477 [Arctium lappa]|uniref:Uncharacterized protein n=1 Tax=Arctium lappa TaxID=4217 RepID=A0ACB9FJI6_ARCLA|nr:hypothetical protein L6452_02477 [Arctium lappa]
MANILADHGEAVDIIYDGIQILVVEEKKRQACPSIFSIHLQSSKNLRDVSPIPYTPRIVSIGPFHKDDQNMKGVEVHKVTYLLDLFRRLKSPRDQTMKACVNTVLAQTDRIKAYYEGQMKTYEL